jgi:hypothetical protein
MLDSRSAFNYISLANDARGLPPFLIVASTFPLARRKSICYILNYMVQYNETRLDASFAALSDATRRGVLE